MVEDVSVVKYYIHKLIQGYREDGAGKTMQRLSDYVRWRNPLRVMTVKAIQRRRLREQYSSDCRRLIIFLTIGHDWVNGGILSINSIYNETCKLKAIHGAAVVMCTAPGGNLLLRYTKFRNKNYLYSLAEVLSHFRKVESLLIHVPELYVQEFIDENTFQEFLQCREAKDLRVNILLQNIELAPSRADIEKIKKLGRTTCTTAHEAYSTPATEARLGCRIHKLSTYGSPEQYTKRAYYDKKNLMIVSPDMHERKATILKRIRGEFPKLRLTIIKNMKYEDYKKIISKAKWAITFGEGLDGYFVEPIFSGGVSFAVYNEKFFTKDFKELETVYLDYETLIRKICGDMRKLDNERSYTEYQKEQFDRCAKYYDYKVYVDNVASFYKKYYSNVNGE